MSAQDLSARLAALANEAPEFRNRARVLDASDPLASLLDEIDATILSSELVFETGDKTLRLLVTGRRLNRILEGASDDLLDKPLSPDSPDLIAHAAEALAAFSNDAKDLRVTHGPVPVPKVDMSDRVSVTALSAGLGFEEDDPDASLPERFLNRLGDAVIAAIHMNDRVAGDTIGAGGDVSGLKITLSTQLSAFLNARQTTCASHSDPSLTLFADVSEDGVSLGIAIFDAQSLLFSLPTDRLADASTAFRRIT